MIKGWDKFNESSDWKGSENESRYPDDKEGHESYDVAGPDPTLRVI